MMLAFLRLGHSIRAAAEGLEKHSAALLVSHGSIPTERSKCIDIYRFGVKIFVAPKQQFNRRRFKEGKITVEFWLLN
jgi:hypothetical protein